MEYFESAEKLAACDYLTILTTRGLLATKKIIAIPGQDPKIVNYAKAARFSFTERPIASFDDLAAVLTDLQRWSHTLIVRGKPAPGINRHNDVRRLKPRKKSDGTIEPATLVSQPRRWLPIDMDSVPCPSGIDPIHEPDLVVEYVISLLPNEFHDVSVFWYFTGGHGFKPGIRIRLFYWLDRPVLDDEAKLWLAGPIAEGLIDAKLFHPIQEIYVAQPTFDGTTDPLPYRYGIWRGDRDAVPVPVITKPVPLTIEPQPI